MRMYRSLFNCLQYAFIKTLESWYLIIRLAKQLDSNQQILSTVRLPNNQIFISQLLFTSCFSPQSVSQKKLVKKNQTK